MEGVCIVGIVTQHSRCHTINKTCFAVNFARASLFVVYVTMSLIPIETVSLCVFPVVSTYGNERFGFLM